MLKSSIKDKNILQPGVVWITGLSASGKTTLSSSLYKRLKDDNYENVRLNDGESYREEFGKKYGFNHKYLGYSLTARKGLTKHFVKDMKDYVNSGLLVIVATLDHKVKSRQNTRKEIQGFMEVYLQCSVDVCAKRDYKGHYERAFAKEKGYELFPGVTNPYEPSDNPELILHTDKHSIEECSIKLYQETLKMFQT